jgi:hypothetical protein
MGPLITCAIPRVRPSAPRGIKLRRSATRERIDPTANSSPAKCSFAPEQARLRRVPTSLHLPFHQFPIMTVRSDRYPLACAAVHAKLTPYFCHPPAPHIPIHAHFAAAPSQRQFLSGQESAPPGIVSSPSSHAVDRSWSIQARSGRCKSACREHLLLKQIAQHFVERQHSYGSLQRTPSASPHRIAHDGNVPLMCSGWIKCGTSGRNFPNSPKWEEDVGQTIRHRASAVCGSVLTPCLLCTKCVFPQQPLA